METGQTFMKIDNAGSHECKNETGCKTIDFHYYV